MSKWIPITTDATIGRDLRASLAQQQGAPVGLTWRTFKAAMDLLGVRDDDRIASIDFGNTHLGGGGWILRDDAPDGIEIREKHHAE